MLRLLLLFIISISASFSAADEASEKQTRFLWKILNRTNLDPTSQTAQEMNDLVEQGKMREAAMLAVRSPDSSFVTGAVRQTFTNLAGRELSNTEPSGDFVLTFMVGAALDIPVKDLFLKDIRYSTTSSLSKSQATAAIDNFLATNVSDQQIMTAINNQQIFNHGQEAYISESDYRLGVVTSLQYGQSIFAGGTNRRPIGKLTENFLCVPSIEQLMNFTITDRWVGRDIPRSPGDDPLVYLNRCVGCHTGLDSLRGAFAGYDFLGDQVLWGNNVRGKMNNDQHVFPAGYFVNDHSWQHLGWLPIAPNSVGEKYVGAKPLVKMIVDSPQFYKCMVKRAKDTLCPKKDPLELTLAQLAFKFESQQKLTNMYADVAVNICMME